MVLTVWSVVRAFAGLGAGSSCRRCSERIPAHDAFGMSESVCRPCRVSPA